MAKTRVAVIGAGYLGRFHAQKYSKLDTCELIGVVDVDMQKAEELAGTLSTSAYSSYEDIIGSVQSVSIVTPTVTHHKIALDFISRGVNVLLEKPMTIEGAQAQELIDASERHGAILQIGHLERFNGAVVALKDRDIRPMFIESHRLSGFPNRGTDVDVVLDLMIHDIDIILNLVKSDIESLDAAGVPIISDKVDIANARLRFQNGCVANVTASRVSLEPMRRLRIFQPDAYIAVDYAKQHISISKRRLDKATGTADIVTEDLDIELKDSLNEEIKSFIDACRTKTRPLVSGRDGKRALEVARRIQDSVAESMERVNAHSQRETKGLKTGYE